MPPSFVHAAYNLTRAAVRRLGVRNPLAKPPMPTNLQVPPATTADIAYQVDYAITNGSLYRDRLKDMGIDIAGARILEVGPGIAFGGMAWLRAAGAEVAVTDRWLAAWSDPFHGPVYSALADKLDGVSGFDVAPLRQMVADKGYSESTIRCIYSAAEDLSAIGDGAFDAVVSNAVLEHIKDEHKSFAELFRITRPGGVGLHQVDFRDHRNFDRPLEHLLLPKEKFEAINDAVHAEFGSQRRQPDYAAALTGAGFVIEHYERNDQVSASYVEDLLRRLKESGRPIPPAWTAEALADVGGLFRLRRP
ncbi:MAG TPA: methyltransferase domain-containing protein [Hyphomonadaceae bacterium]|nr:methyltransferase domain-containing protein [Hyphomonadaceae bacterium]